ncbi:MAG: methylmalonyl-CoA mutase family protein [Gammaproteobacteria bacterium]|nr:methylmalonyl-CoA mutase family protein [Gammaproteobacteria bacterium]
MTLPVSNVTHLVDVDVDPRYRVRFITAASLFDGHDASINIIRRMLQAGGVEVIHLGHNRSVKEIVDAAIEEDVQGIAVSSYQGGHVEFFRYMLDMLRDNGRGEIRVFGGGGGVIVPEEIRELEAYGIARIYSPEDGQRIGLRGIIEDMVHRADFYPGEGLVPNLESTRPLSRSDLARVITLLENETAPRGLMTSLEQRAANLGRKVPVLGITGTGGSGKSSLTDELILRWRLDHEDQLRVAVLAIDPSRRRSGGALLGDRIRMNAIDGDSVYLRSLATRSAVVEVPPKLPDIITATKAAGFDLIIVETPGIGQGDAGIVSHVDVSLYVMTPEFGSASQLEKIDMLDFADCVAINKFDRKGADDALRDVRKQFQRNQTAFETDVAALPVFGTIASHFNDDGVTALYQELSLRLSVFGLAEMGGDLQRVNVRTSSTRSQIVPADRQRYLSEISATMRGYRARAESQAQLVREAQYLGESAALLEGAASATEVISVVGALAEDKRQQLDATSIALLADFKELRNQYGQDELVYTVRNQEIRQPLVYTSLSGTRIPRVSLPRYSDNGDLLRWLMLENLPGHFPYTAGVFPIKRQSEDPTRMFAGEGDAFRTNRRFHVLSESSSAKRLSTAFDSVTLYGADPGLRPDIYGKVGTSGVSIATFDDMKALYAGFDLCDPSTSVSMTINGPAPTVLAFFLNTAIDQQMDRFRADHDREPDAVEAEKVRCFALQNVRGTVQADILKEDQGQNTCLFSTEFSIKMMGDIQQYFIDHSVRNFYSVSISGYHIAEAGANPITQLALTLSNGFTYVEAYCARGMAVDDFAANLSFFFSNGMDPEYTVIGRVARRIWAVAMRECYGASERSQKLKYHVQTSGRSLHAQEISFNDIRTTLQALIAVYDNCNSLHTNANDEAITTPSEVSVRRALAIQMIINREWGLAKNENPNQGSFIIDELTDLVEEAVLLEFDRISERGGVLGAMETGYQRGRIQDESMHYEHMKHDGSQPIIGVNMFLAEGDASPASVELTRGTEEEKHSQICRLAAFQEQHRAEAPAALGQLQSAALNDENVFAQLMVATRYCSLGQITDALFEVGGRYRRSM